LVFAFVNLISYTTGVKVCTREELFEAVAKALGMVTARYGKY
jgi:hypothetical protein